MNQNFLRPNVSRTAFWDIDWNSLDFQADSALIMNKVFNYGTWTDILEVFRFYGLDRVRREVIQSAYYKATALSFLCLILDLNEHDFTAYQTRKTRQSVWNY